MNGLNIWLNFLKLQLIIMLFAWATSFKKGERERHILFFSRNILQCNSKEKSQTKTVGKDAFIKWARTFFIIIAVIPTATFMLQKASSDIVLSMHGLSFENEINNDMPTCKRINPLTQHPLKFPFLDKLFVNTCNATKPISIKCSALCWINRTRSQKLICWRG